MLTLTPTAAAVLDETRTRQGIPDDTTLRVASAPADNGDQAGITIGFVDQPIEGDHTGEAHGMSYCVSPEVADALSDAQLDVQREGEESHLVLVPAG
jgi:Fe-S cluster assembly iron-binding protein IscA